MADETKTPELTLWFAEGPAERFSPPAGLRLRVVGPGEDPFAALPVGTAPDRIAVLAEGGRLREGIDFVLALGEPHAFIALAPAPPEAETPILPEGISSLLVIGTEDRRLDPAAREALRRALPEAYPALIYAAGSDPLGERGAATSEILGDYLLRREAFVVRGRSAKLFD